MVDDKSLNIWVVEYSSIQKCFHYHQLKDAIRKNLEMFRRDHTEMNGYMPIAVCSTLEEAGEVCDMFSAYRDKKEGIVYQEVP